MKILLTNIDNILGQAIYGILEARSNIEVSVLKDFKSVRAVCATFEPEVILHLDIDGETEVNKILLCEAIKAMPRSPRVIYAASLEEYHDSLFDDSEIDTHNMYFNDINLRLFDIVDSDSPLVQMVKDAQGNKTIRASCAMSSFCSVEDAAPWICEFVFRIYDVKSGTYNIGNPNNFTSMKRIALKIKRILKSDSIIETFNDSISILKRPTVSKALEFYEPKCDLDHIINQLAS